MSSKCLASLGDNRPPRGQVDIRRDSPALPQASLDTGLEFPGHQRAVLTQNFEDVAPYESGVLFRIDKEHVHDAGGEELNDKFFVGEDKILIVVSATDAADFRILKLGVIPWNMQCRTFSSGS